MRTTISNQRANSNIPTIVAREKPADTPKKGFVIKRKPTNKEATPVFERKAAPSQQPVPMPKTQMRTYQELPGLNKQQTENKTTMNRHVLSEVKSVDPRPLPLFKEEKTQVIVHSTNKNEEEEIRKLMQRKKQLLEERAALDSESEQEKLRCQSLAEVASK